MGFMEKRVEAAVLQDYIANFKPKTELVKEIITHQDGSNAVDMDASSESVLETIAKLDELVANKASSAELEEFEAFVQGSAEAVANAYAETRRKRGEDPQLVSDAEAEALDGVEEALTAAAKAAAAAAAAEAAKKREEARKKREEANKRRREEAAAAAAEEEKKRKEAEAAEKAAAEAEKAEAEKRAKAEARAKADAKRKEEAAKRKQRLEAAKKKREEAEAAEAAKAVEMDENAKAAAASAAKKRELGANARYHTVSGGENLSKISERYYGHQGNWSLIYNANRDLLTNPNIIVPGQKLLIP